MCVSLLLSKSSGFNKEAVTLHVYIFWYGVFVYTLWEAHMTIIKWVWCLEKMSRTHIPNFIIYNPLCTTLLTGEQLIAQFHDIFNNGVSFLVPYEQSVSYDFSCHFSRVDMNKKKRMFLFVVWRVEFKVEKKN